MQFLIVKNAYPKENGVAKTTKPPKKAQKPNPEKGVNNPQP